jgi:hypothetical protein
MAGDCRRRFHASRRRLGEFEVGCGESECAFEFDSLEMKLRSVRLRR